MPDQDDQAIPPWSRRLSENPDELIPLLPAGARPDPASTRQPHEPVKSGVLNVDKPPGQTSHDVVQAVRRASGVRRVGHAGTLDPMATGVLVVCIGSATRVIDDIQEGTKEYEATLRLGIATDTYDAEGTVVSTCDASAVTSADVEAALQPFRGTIDQVPPMYSAVRHKGQRLYELARKGIEVERTPRPVTVHLLELTAWDPPDLTLSMTVSKGTYVRAIAHDLGTALGVGAHLTALRRTAVGRFRAADASRLPDIVEAFLEGSWPRLLYPLDSALLDYPALIVDDETETAIRHGQQATGAAPPAPDATRIRAYNADGLFVATLRWDPITARWQPARVFPKP